jgi:hypothetical protein
VWDAPCRTSGDLPTPAPADSGLARSDQTPADGFAGQLGDEPFDEVSQDLGVDVKCT